MKRLLEQWFLIALIGFFALGWACWPTVIVAAQKTWLRDGLVALSMFLMALPLEGSAIQRAITRPWASLIALGVTYGLLPLFAWALCEILPTEFFPPEYAAGLLVAAITPCTMASATVWTRKAGGNDSAATVVTVLTNLLSFLVTPVWMSWLTGSAPEFKGLAFFETLQKLAVTIAAPILLAQALRGSLGVRDFAKARAKQIGIFAQLCILTMVTFGAAQTGKRLAAESWNWDIAVILAVCFGVVVLVHLVMFSIGFQIARWFGLPWADQVAVGFSGSQKTLMVGMQLSIAAGASVIPMVAYHVSQLMVDTLLADWIRQGRPQDEQPPG